MQQVQAKDDLGERLAQGMVAAGGVVAPVAAVGAVPGLLWGIRLAAQQVLARLDAAGGGREGDVGRVGRGIEQRLVKGGLHVGQGMDGEGGHGGEGAGEGAGGEEQSGRSRAGAGARAGAEEGRPCAADGGRVV